MSSEDEDEKFLYSDDETTATKHENQDLNTGDDNQPLKKLKVNGEPSADSNQSDSDSDAEDSDEDNDNYSESDSDIEIIIGSGNDTTRIDSGKSKISTITETTPIIDSTPAAKSVSVEAQPLADAKGSAGTSGQQQSIDLNPDAQFDEKPLVEIDPEILKEKPWRQAGSNLLDYFNYGFNEATWMEYLHRQEHLRKEYNPQKVLMNLLALQQQGKFNNHDSVPSSQNTMSAPQPPAAFPPIGMNPMFGGFPPFPFPGMMGNMPTPNQSNNNDK